MNSILSDGVNRLIVTWFPMSNFEHDNPEKEKLATFSELRRKIHEKMDDDIKKRASNNPKPTEEECMVGAYKEMIELQVRDAVFEFSRKGYPSESSGFYGNFGEEQAIDGFFQLDQETIQKIERLGATVEETKDHSTRIFFKPDSPDLEAIKSKWKQIAEILPVRSDAIEPATSGGAEDFRKHYSTDQTDIEKRSLQRRLNLMKFEPSAEIEMRNRIREIEKVCFLSKPGT